MVLTGLENDKIMPLLMHFQQYVPLPTQYSFDKDVSINTMLPKGINKDL